MTWQFHPLSIYPREMKTLVYKKTCKHCVLSNFTYNDPKLETPKCLSKGQRTNTLIKSHVRMLLGKKKEQSNNEKNKQICVRLKSSNFPKMR